MVGAIALLIAEAIKKVEPEKTASIAVMKYSLEVIIQTLLTLLYIGIIGILTDALTETMFGALGFVVLRFFSGGLHLRTAIHCSITSTILISIAPHIPLNGKWIIIVTGVSFVLMLCFAPSNIERHARIPKKYFPFLKLISTLIVALNFFFLESYLAMVFLFQAITTIPYRKEAKK
ncbi:accessory gene regulator ArgB-like protein [Cohnella luojiensis]|nr:accessory gene regulator B family protein [Cohnella luojiensis]